MPVNQVKTPEQEKLWNRAKAQAKKQGKGENWAYISSIYQNMKGASLEDAMTFIVKRACLDFSPSEFVKAAIGPRTFRNALTEAIRDYDSLRWIGGIPDTNKVRADQLSALIERLSSRVPDKNPILRLLSSGSGASDVSDEMRTISQMMGRGQDLRSAGRTLDDSIGALYPGVSRAGNFAVNRPHPTRSIRPFWERWMLPSY